MTELIFPVCLSMISNQSQGAPGLVSFCFLTTSKSETIFLIVIIVPPVSSVRCPHSGAGAGVRPRFGKCGPGSAIHQPEPGPEARMMRVLVWVRQGWSQDKNREAEPWPGDPAWCIRGGRGRPVGGGGGWERERRPSGHRSHGASLSVRRDPGQNGPNTSTRGSGDGTLVIIGTVLTSAEETFIRWTLDKIQRRRKNETRGWAVGRWHWASWWRQEIFTWIMITQVSALHSF